LLVVVRMTDRRDDDMRYAMRAVEFTDSLGEGLEVCNGDT
jgi:hypothetical protein